MDKKFYLKIMFFLIIIIFFQCGKSQFSCQSNTKLKNESYTKAVEEYAKKIEKMVNIDSYSDVSPNPMVISERAAIKGLIKYTVESNADDIELFKDNPRWQGARIGQLILVEDIGSPLLEKQPYYYFVTIVNQRNYSLAKGLITAEPNTEYTGSVGETVYSKDYTVPVKYMSEEDVKKYFMDNYLLSDSDIAHIKAVYYPFDIGGHMQWGWAVKLNKSIEVKDPNGYILSSQFFWLNPQIYDFKSFENYTHEHYDSSTDEQNPDKVIEETYQWFAKRTRIAILSKDVFKDVAASKSNFIRSFIAEKPYIKVTSLKYITEQYDKK